MNDSHSPNLTPSDHELLAFVEGSLSPVERRALQERLARSPRTLRRLRALQRDREAMTALEDPDVPEWLAARIAQMAFSANWITAEADSNDEPAPLPVVAQLPNRRYALPRLAMAASILLALSASLMVTWWAASEVTHFATGLFDSPGPLQQPLVSSGETVLAHENASDSDHVEIVNESTSVETGTQLASAEPFTPEPDVSGTYAETPVVIEVGTAVRIASGNRLDTLEHLAAALLGSGHDGLGGMIVNATIAPVGPSALERSGPAHAIAGLSGRVLDEYGRELPPPPSRSDAAPHEVSLVVPPLDQLRYSGDGFAYTLVGLPSDILALLDALVVRPDHRLYWYSQDGLTRLRLLVRPPAPTGAELIAALHWFGNPAASLILTAQLLASAREEPLVQVPLKVVEWGSLHSRPMPDMP